MAALTAGAVTGGEQVEQQTADGGESQPGAVPGHGRVRPCGDLGGHERLQPVVHEPFEKRGSLGAAPQRVPVDFEEEPLLTGQSRVRQLLPEEPRSIGG